MRVGTSSNRLALDQPSVEPGETNGIGFCAIVMPQGARLGNMYGM